MKDPERMDKEEKRRYIFEDTSFEGRTRFNWITDCLLGDILTFLDGIEYKGEPAGKRPRGGGNLSVPILINTALEFVAALYAGKTNYMKFSIDAELKEELDKCSENNGFLSEKLKNVFKSRNFPLPEKLTIKKKGNNRWEITDKNDGVHYIAENVKE